MLCFTLFYTQYGEIAGDIIIMHRNAAGCTARRESGLLKYFVGAFL